MFTGIVEEIGSILAIRPANGGVVLQIDAPGSIGELNPNDSIAVNGVCLTVESKQGAAFSATAVEETLRKTTLGNLRSGSKVNLELPLRFNERLGGHLVLGHVDAVGKVVKITKLGTSTIFGIYIPPEFRKYTVPVGSIAVDGVSLTLAAVERDSVNVAIIPHTIEKTIFRNYRDGDAVNLEFDIVGKYIERMVFPEGTEGRSPGFFKEGDLKEQGF